jgi:hypothetical protein
MAISKIPSAGFQDNVKFRNIIINGDMSIAQRGTSFATMGNSDTQYTLDRFQWNEEGTFGDAELTITQDTTVPTGQGFAKSLKAACTTADTSIDSGTISYITQKFEGQNLQYLKKGTSSAKSLTLSFWARSNLTGTFTVAFKDIDNSRLYSASYSPSSADTWEKFFITIPGDTSGALDNDNAHSFSVDWNLQAGTSKSNGALTTAWEAQAEGDRAVGQTNFFSSTSNTFYLTGVQLEAGTSASDFEFLPVDVNLERCKRYYQLLDGGDATSAISVAASYSTTTAYSVLSLNPEMRTQPSIDQVTGTDYYSYLNAGNTRTFDSFAGSTGNSTNKFMRINNADDLSTNTTAGQSGWIKTDNTSAFLAFDAEL